MRSLFLPAGLVVCGTLAALPFRRPNAAPPAPPQDSTTPATVTPLSEGPAAGQASAPPEPLSPPQWSTFKRPLPEHDAFGAAPLKLPASYDDVAIPLAIDPDPNNLLPQVRAPLGNRSRLSRYGIPLDAYDSQHADTALARSSDAQWSPPQPFDTSGQTASAPGTLAQSSAAQSHTLPSNTATPPSHARPQGQIRAVSQSGPAASEASANASSQPPRPRENVITEPKSTAAKLDESITAEPIRTNSPPLSEPAPAAPAPTYRWRTHSTPKPSRPGARNYIREPAYSTDGK